MQTSLPSNNLETTTKVNPVFARHETFHPRFGWLKKGFDQAKLDTGIFVADDAPIRLGVGKNMVKSIRYWCNAYKVLDSDAPSAFGEKILSDEGWDPFLEDPASLWLLHWNLLKPTCEAAAWYYTFNVFRASEFTTDDLFNGLRDYKDILGKNLVDESLKKDINCIIRMYVEQRNQNGPIEDSIDCPFTELGLIHTAGDSKRYTFRIGAKSHLPAEIVVAACLEYLSFNSYGQKTVAISRLLYDNGSPGMVFKLTENAICDAIEQVARKLNKVAISDTAGLIQFSFNDEPKELAADILERYYSTRGQWA